MSDAIAITGNIATTPEHKKIAGGIPLTSFRLASSQRRLDRDTGQWVDGETNFYTVSVFRALAEHAVLSLRRGDRVIVTGRLKVKEWDNGTRKRTTVEIEADAIGHDLKFGTSTFQRAAARTESTPDADAWPTGADTAGEEATEWSTAAPGSARDAAGPGSTDAGDDDSSAVEDRRTVLSADPTPF